MVGRCAVLWWCVLLMAALVGSQVHAEGGEGEDVGVEAPKGRAEDQLWLREILQREEFDYNAAGDPFEDLPPEERPRVLRCLPPRAAPRNMSYTHAAAAPPAATATLVVAMDLKQLGHAPRRGATAPLTLCVADTAGACGAGDAVAVHVEGGAAWLHVRLGGWVLVRRLGAVVVGRRTRVFFAVLQNVVLWRHEDGSTLRAALPPSSGPAPRHYNVSAVFCGGPGAASSFPGDISNVMINFRHLLFAQWDTPALPPPAALKPYYATQEYELSHAVLRCPRPRMRRLHLALQGLRNNLHRVRDCVLLYVPYPPAAAEQQGTRTEVGWGVVLTAGNRVVFCYDVLHRHGCQGFAPPSLSSADLAGLRLRLVGGVLHVEALTSVSHWRGVSLRQYAAPLPCPDALYLGSLPAHLSPAVRRQYQAFEGRLGPLTVNGAARLNPKTYTRRAAARVGENLVTYALPALSVRGGAARYVERRVTPGRATHATCPPGVRGDWHDAAGRVLARGREVIRIAWRDDVAGEGVYVCTVPHARLGRRVLTATTVYYKAHVGGLASRRPLKAESRLAVPWDFAAAWVVVTALAVVVAAVGGRGLALWGRKHPWRRAALATRDVHGLVYQVHALHRRLLARLTPRQRRVVDPLRRMYKTSRASIDLEKLFSSGRWKAARRGLPDAPAAAPVQPLPPASLRYPHDYRRVAAALMGRPRVKRRRWRRRAASPPPPSMPTPSTPYNE